MSNFERAKRNLLADIASCKTHTAESWAQIMLKNTAGLTTEADQKKFWTFMMNPNDEENIPMPRLERATHKFIEQPETVTVPLQTDDEKSEQVVMENRFHREGYTMFIETRPTANSSVSMPLLAGRDLSESDSDEKTAIEIS